MRYRGNLFVSLQDLSVSMLHISMTPVLFSHPIDPIADNGAHKNSDDIPLGPNWTLAHFPNMYKDHCRTITRMAMGARIFFLIMENFSLFV